MSRDRHRREPLGAVDSAIAALFHGGYWVRAVALITRSDGRVRCAALGCILTDDLYSTRTSHVYVMLHPPDTPLNAGPRHMMVHGRITSPLCRGPASATVFESSLKAALRNASARWRNGRPKGSHTPSSIIDIMPALGGAARGVGADRGREVVALGSGDEVERGRRAGRVMAASVGGGGWMTSRVSESGRTRGTMDTHRRRLCALELEREPSLEGWSVHLL